MLLKGYMELLAEEVASYPDPSQIDPCSIAFTPLGDEGNLLSNLPRILELPEIAMQEEEWNKAGPEIVDGMVSLVQNYRPAGATYTPEETRQFVSMASLQQLAYHDHVELIQRVHGDGEAVDMDAFPTLKAMTYTVFHKFYADHNRKSSNSDAFDVLIAALLPYVEAFITENHQAEVLRKTKRRDNFLGGLQVFTLRDFRDAPPRQSTARGLRTKERRRRTHHPRRDRRHASVRARASPPSSDMLISKITFGIVSVSFG